MLFRKRPYSVKPQGRAGFVYTENDMSIYVFSEFMRDVDFDLVAYLSRVTHWDPPSESMELTNDDRERIKQNVSQALRVRIEWA